MNALQLHYKIISIFNMDEKSFFIYYNAHQSFLFGAFLDSLFACAQGSRVITVVVQVGEVKIYVAAADEALRKNERQDETQIYHQNWWKN